MEARVNDWLERNDRLIARIYAAVLVALLVVATGFFATVALGVVRTGVAVG